MSHPFSPKTERLKFDSLIESLKEIAENLFDHRTGKNGKYEMQDAVLSAFSLFFTQSRFF